MYGVNYFQSKLCKELFCKDSRSFPEALKINQKVSKSFLIDPDDQTKDCVSDTINHRQCRQ